jgi:uncharacterized membrane protein YdbT with pleckstrin-like domain
MKDFYGERIIRAVHPAKFRKHPLLFLIVSALILVYGIGIVFILIWWIIILSETLIITDKRVIYRKGIFSRDEMEIPHSQIGTITIHQNLLDLFLDIGTIKIASAGTSGYEMALEGMPSPGNLKHLIDANQH